MKAYELAKALIDLAGILKKMPNVELYELGNRLSGSLPRRYSPSPENIPVALSTLVALSRLDKQQWLSFIHNYNFPIDIRPRDASRDILGKLLKHLEENPADRKKISDDAQRQAPKASPELLRALSVLLKE